MKKALICILLAACQSSYAAISFTGTAVASSTTQAGIVASTTVGVLLNLDSGTDWSQLANVPAGTAFTTGSQLTINSVTFTVFGRNTASGLGSVPGTASNFTWSGGMTASDQFAVLLFPNATQANGVSGGTGLKLFRNTDWAQPANDTSGSSYAFATTGAAFTQVSGSGAAPTLSFTVVPEPSTYALLGMSAMALGGYVVRRRRRA